MLKKILNKQREHMEKAKVKTKERSARIEDVRVNGINKLDSKFNSIQQELEVSKEKNDKKILTTRIKEQIKEDEAPSCSKCGSKHITAQKQGFGIGKAVIGVVALGPVGSLAGGINKNKIELTCLKCGHKFKIKR